MKITPIRKIAIALLVALGLSAALPLSAEASAPKEPEVQPVQVTYFFLPG